MANLQFDEDVIRNVVAQVLAEVGPAPEVAENAGFSATTDVAGTTNIAETNFSGRHGVFQDANEAIAAARIAFEQLAERGLEDRRKIIGHIRRIVMDDCTELGTMEMDETKVGRVEHKIEKLKTLGETCPGVEFLQSRVFSGEHGLTVVEHAPFGVIGAITPATHSLPTIAGNAISMISAGNSLVANPHPSGKKVAAEGVRRFNQAIHQDIGIDNLICVVAEPTLDSANIIFNHPKIALICVTGGPMVARAALRAGKRAVVAGPGNPPVVVDETADLDNAARCIIAGAAYDNNLLCIAEKEVFVVDSVFDEMMSAMERAGAARLSAGEVDQLTSTAIHKVGDDQHDAPRKEFIGQDAAVLAKAIGKRVSEDVELLFGETDEHNPFVSVEQMMPFVPFVRCPDFKDAVKKAQHYEHGFRHTSIIHSRNVKNLTYMGKVMDTTLFVKNGPCVAGLGLGGEGYISFSIAGPTGEGVTNPMTFTRERRCTLVDDLWVLGKPTT